jgi:hypothetical protein
MIEYIEREVMRPVCGKTKILIDIYLRDFKTVKVVGKRLSSSSYQKYFYVRKYYTERCLPEIKTREEAMQFLGSVEY